MEVDKLPEVAQAALMRLGIALRDARGAVGQEELRDLTGISQSTLSRIEAGKHDTTVSEVVLLEDALKLDRGALLVSAELVEGVASVGQAIRADRLLDDQGRDWLQVAYTSAVAASRSRRRAGNR